MNVQGKKVKYGYFHFVCAYNEKKQRWEVRPCLKAKTYGTLLHADSYYAVWIKVGHWLFNQPEHKAWMNRRDEIKAKHSQGRVGNQSELEQRFENESYGRPEGERARNSYERRNYRLDT